MIGDIGIAVSLLVQVVILNYPNTDFSKLPVVGMFVLTVQLSLCSFRGAPNRQATKWRLVGTSLLLFSICCAFRIWSITESYFTTLFMLLLVYFFADLVKPNHFHSSGLGVLFGFCHQMMVVMLTTEVLCNYVSFGTMMQFLPTYLMYQSYDLAREVTTLDTDVAIGNYTLASVLGRYDSMHFSCLINIFAYVFVLVDIVFSSYWRGLVLLLVPMMLKSWYLFVNFKLDRLPGQYLKLFLLFSATSIISFILSA
jgi:1,4-dihydroxy-2-naphthoate octaprenyltransferase